MEVVAWFFAEQGLSLVLGAGGGWGYCQYRLWKIRRHAPSAKEVSFHVGLTQEDFDRLQKKDDDVLHIIVPSAPQSTPDAPSS